MDHVVYVDAKANELEALLDGKKTAVLRGAAGRKLPYGRVSAGDRLYLIRNNGEGQVRASALVREVEQLGPLSEEESAQALESRQGALQLTAAQQKRWAGKRYLVVIAVQGAAALEPFAIDRSAYGSMDDWLPVGEIDSVRV